MKKIMLLCSLLIMIGSPNFMLGFSNVDAAKMGHRYFQQYFQHRGIDGDHVTRAEAKLVVGLGDLLITPQVFAYTAGSFMHREHRNYLPFAYTSHNWKHHDNPILNVMKNHIWYSPDLKAVYAKEYHSGWGGITQPVVFAASDFGIKKGAEALNEFDSVKSITQSIPAQHRMFFYKNGKMVVASAVAQLARTAVEQGSEGMTTDNASQFAQKAGMHFAAEGIEEYGVSFISDHVLGKEESTKKDLLNCGLSFAGFLALNAVIGGSE